MQRPLPDAIIAQNAVNQSGAQTSRQSRDQSVTIRNASRARVTTSRSAARRRVAITRGRLQFEMLQLMKLGCSRPRSIASAETKAGRRAEGCVVCSAARVQAARSEGERKSWRGEPGWM